MSLLARESTPDPRDLCTCVRILMSPKGRKITHATIVMLALPQFLLENMTMAEHSPFFGEHISESETDQFFDAIGDAATWQVFCNRVSEVERHVARYSLNNPEHMQEIQLYEMALRTQFHPNHIGRRSRILGLAYPAGQENLPIADTKMLDTDQVTYTGIELRHANHQWRAMLRFDCPANSDHNDVGTYYVPPSSSHIMNLELLKPPLDNELTLTDRYDEDDHVSVFLKKDFRVVSTSTAGRYFEQAPPDEQRNIIADILDHINGDFPREYRDRDVAIDCKKFYTVYDVTPNLDLSDSFTDTSKDPSGLNRTLIGYIEGFDFPEVKALSVDQPLHHATLHLNDGSYCMVLRNDKEGKTYYILPQTISDIQ